MKKIATLLLAFAAPLLTAAPASAWWCHHCRVPMAPMPMMSMPMMGVGMMPTLPMGLGVMPSIAGTSGMSMHFAMTGDMTMALLLPGLLRNLAGQFLGAPGANGMSDTQLRAIAERIAPLLGVSPATTKLAEDVIQELRLIRQQFQKNSQSGRDSQSSDNSNSAYVPSPEVYAARSEIRRLVNEGTAGQKAADATELARARAEIQRLVAKGARQNGGEKGELQRVRAEVRRLVAEGAAPKNGQNKTHIVRTKVARTTK